MDKILKFRYILWFVLLVGCGETATKKGKDISPEETQLQNEVTEEKSDKVILFFGDSLTAGYGLDPETAFPAIVQDKLDSLQLDYTVVNAGLSGETTAGGKNRLSWVLNQKIDIFVLELGANDGLRGIPLQETRSNLQAIIDAVREKNPNTEILLAGMQIPPNMGPDYTSEFRKVFPELAEKNDLYLIPFLLDGVAGIPELNLEDGIHPTVEGQKVVANNVWEVLKGLVVK